MHKPESIVKNGAHGILWNFKIQTHFLISPRRPQIVLMNTHTKRRTCYQVDFAVPADHRLKIKESKKLHKCMDLAVELENRGI